MVARQYVTAVAAALIGVVSEASAQVPPGEPTTIAWDGQPPAEEATAPTEAATPVWGDALTVVPTEEAPAQPSASPQDEEEDDDEDEERAAPTSPVLERRPSPRAPIRETPMSSVWPSYFTRYPTRWEAPANDPNRTDPLLWAGGALAGVGVALLVGGVAWRQTAHGPEHCGLSGCFDVKDDAERARATSLMVAGAATALTGGSVALAGLGGSPPQGVRRNETMMMAGAVITSAGIASGTAGAALIIAAAGGDHVNMSQPIASFVGAAAGLGLGIPLWAVGARKKKVELHGGSTPTLLFDGKGVTCLTRF